MKKKPQAKLEEPFQMAKSKKQEGWYNGTTYIPLSEMTDEHLQNAKIRIQSRELFYYKRINKLASIAEKLDEEAERRGITLRDHGSEYHTNTRRFKNHLRKDQKKKNGDKSSQQPRIEPARAADSPKQH